MIKFLQKIFKRTDRKVENNLVSNLTEQEQLAVRSVELLVELQKNNPAFAEELKKNNQLLSDALTILKTDDSAEKEKLYQQFVNVHLSSDEIMKEYYRKQLLNSNLNNQLPN